MAELYRLRPETDATRIAGISEMAPGRKVGVPLIDRCLRFHVQGVRTRKQWALDVPRRHNHVAQRVLCATRHALTWRTHQAEMLYPTRHQPNSSLLRSVGSISFIS